MSVGLMALLDDVAGLAKVAAASVDDVIGHAAKAGAKSAGVVIDDAAVTPRYVVGFAAERELPIIARIARGSLKNKLVFLLPVALAARLLRRMGDHAAPDDRRRLSRLRGRREGLRGVCAARGARARGQARRRRRPTPGRSRTRRSRARSRPTSSSRPRSWRSRSPRSRRRLLDPRRRAGRGRHPDHRRRLRRRRADREGRRHRRGAGAQRRPLAARPAVARLRRRAGARHAGASCACSRWSAPRR